MNEQQQQVVAALLATWQNQPGALLPLLHAIQEALGWVPEAAVPQVAQALNLSRAEVVGVISFYHDFRTSPPPPHCLRVCVAESCQMAGAEALSALAEQRLGLREGESSDGEWQVRPVYCLGACACSPAVQLDDKLYAQVTPEQLDRLLTVVPLGRMLTELQEAE